MSTPAPTTVPASAMIAAARTPMNAATLPRRAEHSGGPAAE